MAAIKAADFLVEIGTEELPPKALRSLMQAFAGNLASGLTDARLEHGDIDAYASPRRIAALVTDLSVGQASREVKAKGPPVRIAFDTDGNPKPAAIAFAKKYGVDVADLARHKTDKGEWLTYCAMDEGQTAAELLPAIVDQALSSLPIPRPMRWGSADLEFVRPVHWVILLHGKDIVPGRVLGRTTGNTSRGHRFLSSGLIEIDAPGHYAELLETNGFVLADFSVRKQKIVSDVRDCAAAAGGSVFVEDSLYDEVTALTEWPVAMIGHFDQRFLQLPPEAIVATLTGHQRYFPISDDNGKLLPAFVFVANIESSDPDKVRDGNERVVRPRLDDAVFFWQTDRETSLAGRGEALARVVYQKGLGSLADKSERVAELCSAFADSLGVSADSAVRAAKLAKCDLLTGMVGEFPELQGIMGRYYALADGEPAEVATAIGEQYLPRSAGDALPASGAGQWLALADKLDTVAGIFALGKKPSGSKDPFALRRAALGIVRILIEGELELDLQTVFELAVRLQPVDGLQIETVTAEVGQFVAERVRSYYLDQSDVTTEIFDAVSSTGDWLNRPLGDFDQRIDAVKAFASMSEAASLAAANKRISNILLQSPSDASIEVDESLFQDPAESGVYLALREALAEIAPLQEDRNYAAVLARLAALKEPVDLFFDKVLVMSDDEKLKRNRLALLSSLRQPFHSVADISRLSVSKSGD